jgi:hypothetical protein
MSFSKQNSIVDGIVQELASLYLSINPERQEHILAMAQEMSDAWSKEVEVIVRLFYVLNHERQEHMISMLRDMAVAVAKEESMGKEGLEKAVEVAIE